MGLISRVSSRTYRNQTQLITKILKMSGITVTQHDQTKINKFARRHQAQLETKSEIQKITLEIQKINDATQDLDVLFLEEDEGQKCRTKWVIYLSCWIRKRSKNTSNRT